jgi:hypothetical protein
MQKRSFSFLLLALAGCGEAADAAASLPPPVLPPASLAVADPVPVEATPSRPEGKPARIVAGVEVKPIKKDKNAKDIKTNHSLPDAKFQIFFPDGEIRPSAGEFVDIVGPKGFRFLARVAYVKEEQRFDPGGRNPSGVGYFATLFPAEALPADFAPKGEQLIALIPADESRRQAAKPSEAAPSLSDFPGLPEKTKVLSFADLSGDPAPDFATLADKECRFSFVAEAGAWKEVRRSCGKIPEQVRISSYAPPKEDAKVEVIQ